jgi:pimeloyl-ACP methyl ester carboxylesterase
VQDRYVDDALGLIQHLRRRFNQDGIVLVGHSWGSRLGLELVRTHPELFAAYVGVSQVVDHGRATEIARDWLLDVVDPVRDREDWEELNAIPVPAFRHAEFRRLNRLTTTYGGSLDLGMAQFARIVASAPEYTVADYIRLLRGFSRGGGPMHRDGVMEGYNYIASAPVLAVPVYFFMGARDYNTPLALAREYLEVLDAPRKELVVFDASAHQPFLSEPDRFMAELIRVAGVGREIP